MDTSIPENLTQHTFNFEAPCDQPIDDIPSKKTCTGPCGRTLPATPEYFHRNRQRKSKLVPRCKECSSVQKKIYNAARFEERKRHRESHKEQQKEYRKQNHAKISKREKEYRQKNHEHYLELYKQYYANHREQVSERAKQYHQREDVKTRYRELHRRFRERHPGYERRFRQTERGKMFERARHQRRRARKKGAKGAFTAQDITNQMQRQHGKCYYCKKTFGNGHRAYHVDHLVPLSRGGSNDPSNLVLACASCNTSKNDKLLHEWIDGGRLL